MGDDDVNDRPLVGRTALISGASAGIGAALAEGFAARGATVGICARRADRLAEVLERCRAHAPDSRSWTVDLSDLDAVGDFARRADDELGGIDLLVNNAGIVIRETFDHADAIAHAKRTFQVNVEGTLNVTHAWLADLRATKGCIVNLASIGSFVGLPGVVGYSPSKGAIKMLTQSLAGELAKDGVRVNAIAPAVVATAMTTATRENPERLARFMQRTPLGRVAEPEELVGPVVFLASDMASYVTGVTLPVDGGYLAV